MAMPEPTARSILHADLDAFFASVEQLDNPALRGKPVLVGGAGKRGVVAAASYEARVFGCRSAMPMSIARRRCPHAEIVKGSFARYRELSDAIFSIYHEVTPLVQPLSIDEAFLDVTGSRRLLGEPVGIARWLKERVKSQTGLTVSVGVAPNKFLAKLASDLEKPDGLVVIEPGRVHAVLDPLPVTRLWGVGAAAEKRLRALGLRTIGDIRSAPEDVLIAKLGADHGSHLARLARGEDDRPVHSDREAKSISHEQTFGDDLEDADTVRGVLLGQCEQVGRRLRKHERFAKTVTVKIRFGDFETVTRSATMPEPTDLNNEIWRAALGLFDAWAKAGYRPVRLIGIGVGHLSERGSETQQPGLFDAEDQAKRRRLDAATDAIARKHGIDAIGRGRGHRGGKGP
jgi:DNA polymerase-4